MTKQTASPLQECLAHKSKRYRERIGWTQEELQEECCLSLNTIRNIEGCKTDVRLSTVESLADTLGVKPYELLR